jgi:hypothetical protein
VLHQLGVDGVAGVAVVALEVRVQGQAVAHGVQAGHGRRRYGATELRALIAQAHDIRGLYYSRGTPGRRSPSALEFLEADCAWQNTTHGAVTKALALLLAGANRG